jgi:hypothetical protein
MKRCPFQACCAGLESLYPDPPQKATPTQAGRTKNEKTSKWNEFLPLKLQLTLRAVNTTINAIYF